MSVCCHQACEYCSQWLRKTYNLYRQHRFQQDQQQNHSIASMILSQYSQFLCKNTSFVYQRSSETQRSEVVHFEHLLQCNIESNLLQSQQKYYHYQPEIYRKSISARRLVCQKANQNILQHPIHHNHNQYTSRSQWVDILSS